ncbi:WD repeat-containing protein 74-like [Mercenaria mercenaria]|uniref:WD repeat-containing protein 74-like n=1 Tax=Mercenaria mercenaria TaxID=6596 RepID=UPI00234F09FF|nr:WD repeat-containing protein 74-like [Mercenaria mercenaria]
MAAPKPNVFVGSETGLLKGIAVAKGTWKNLNHIETPDKSNEITCLCWNEESESGLTIGMKSSQVATFDVRNQVLSEFTSLAKGKGVHLKAVAKFENFLITGFDSGHVSVHSDSDIVQEITTGSHLQCLTMNNNVLGTGGKEADLKIYDINTLDTGTPIFQAKNVRNDWLNLRVPVWVTGINFLGENKIVTSTGHHQVRVYDTNVQRRPVLDMTFDEYPITAMSPCSDFQVIVGNTQGSMGLLDIRKGKLVHRFKGFAGGIRSIQCHSSLPFVASCGLDRFFRVHDINTKELVHKMYLKSRLNCLLMSKYDWCKDNEESEEILEKDSEIVNSDKEENDDDDNVWEQMEIVKTRTLKRKQLDASEEVIEIKKSSGKKTKTRKKLKRK